MQHDQSVSSSDYGPWALIAGGSEGLGAEFAALLAGAGMDLVLVARKAEPLAQTAVRCRELGVEVRTLAVDLTGPDAVPLITAETRGLEIGLLIYNAGANTCSAQFLEAPMADVASVIDLNVTTMLALIHHYGAGMRRRRRGAILTVGSMAGYLGSDRHTVYGGVKAFGRIFTEGLWLELREHNVDVLHLVLGVTRTPAMERAGLNFDIPGMTVSDPADVAQEGLANLRNGPVHVVGASADEILRRSDTDRASVVSTNHRFMKRLLGES